MSGGRPTSLTLEVQATIVAALRAGNYRTTAAALAGVARQTILNWLTWGAEGKEPYASFLVAVELVEAESEAELVAEVRSAQPAIRDGESSRGADLWQARMTLLERRFPHRWSARVRTTVDEELQALMRRLEERLDEDTFAKVIDASREDAPGEGADAPRH